MDIREGDRVMVNLAPFIGARASSRQSIACRVNAVEGDRVQVTTEYPYRSVTLWIDPGWIEAAQADPLEQELIVS
jgi:translation initiation factor IF-1